MTDIYLDHAATTPMLNEAINALTQSCSEDFANFSSGHSLGTALRKKVEQVRQLILEALGADGDYQVIFTSSATEANNLIAHHFKMKAQGDIFITSADHPSMVMPWTQDKNHSLNVYKIDLDKNGAVDLKKYQSDDFKEAAFVGLAQVNNHNGSIQPLSQISSLVKKGHNRSHFHVDGVQAFLKIPVSLRKLNVDSYTISAHKIGGPKGIAALIIKNGFSLEPQWFGGGQESGLRPSTVPVPLIMSLGAAINAQSKTIEPGYKVVKGLKDQLKQLVEDNLPDAKVLFSDLEAVLTPYIATLYIPKIPADILVRHLSEQRIFVSTSSACSSRNKDNFAVYQALNIDEKYFKNIIRVSFSKQSTQIEIQQFINKLASTIKELEGLYS